MGRVDRWKNPTTRRCLAARRLGKKENSWSQDNPANGPSGRSRLAGKESRFSGKSRGDGPPVAGALESALTERRYRRSLGRKIWSRNEAAKYAVTCKESREPACAPVGSGAASHARVSVLFGRSEPAAADVFRNQPWESSFAQASEDGPVRDQSSSGGVNPLRSTFSAISRGNRKFSRYSRPPALVPPPDILNPPKGCRWTMAPVQPRLR